jgi:hypothetical protein
MKLNSHVRFPVGYEAPSVPESLSGPGTLAELLIHARHWRKEAFGEDGAAGEAAAALSDDGVRKLINLAFYASLVPEEGRHPRFKLVSQKYRSSLTVARFEPVLLDDLRLHRLAPACTRPDCGLLVTEKQNELYCEGVVCVGGLAHSIVPGSPGVYAEARTAEMLVEVYGPGHIRATEVYPGYEYRAGRVRALTGFVAPPEAGTLIDAIVREVGVRLGDRASGRDHSDALTASIVVMHVLERMLRTAVDATHGGAFVFLPPGVSDPAHCGLEVHYRSEDLNLLNDLLQFFEHCLSWKEGGRKHSITRAEQARAKLLTDTEMVGNFSMVDGCVVLGRDLRVFGFGAKILVSPEVAASRLQFFHVESGEEYANDVFMKEIGGTRHQSIARLCQAYPGAMAFTVSQDGDLKLFSSDAKHAYVYGPLDLPTIDGELFVS